MRMFSKRTDVLFHLDTHDVKANPLVCVARVILEKALAANASAVVFGVPDGVQWDWAEAAKSHEAERKAALEDPDLADFEESLRQHLPARSGTLQPDWLKRTYPLLVDGTTMGVPIWFQTAGSFVLHMQIPAPIYPQIFLVLTLLRVGIDYAGEEANNPQCYIELSPHHPNARRFVEVQLNLGRDNTLRLELLGHRAETRPLQTPHLVPTP